MKDIKLNILFLLFLSPCLLPAQTDSLKFMKSGQLKAHGKNAVSQGDPLNAIPYLEKYVKRKPDDAKMIYLLADCYKNTRDYQLAEATYQQAYKAEPKGNIMALFYEATMLKMMGDYDQAKEKFTKFAKEYKQKPSLYKKLAQAEIAGCDTAKSMLTVASKVIVSHMDTNINKANMEMSPISLNDSMFLYASLRTDKKEYYDPSDATVAPPVRKFYYASKNGSGWQFEGEWQSALSIPEENTGNGSFSPDGKRFYFSRCKKNWKNRTICTIYVSAYKNNTWQAPVAINEPVNDPDYSNSQPTVGLDEKGKEMIFFVSNRPKGRGGMDIWYTLYDEKKNIYKNPRNAGRQINTPNDEITPFYDQETRWLYFSSDGLGGMGGQDIFKAVGNAAKWSTPSNIGASINSSTDDVYYSISKNRGEGFFVSNRKGGVSVKNATCCDDIYSYKLKQYIWIGICGDVKVFAKDSLQALVSPNTTISVYYVDKDETDPLFIKSLTADSTGKYCLTLEQGSEYKIIASKNGYLSAAFHFSTKDITENTEANRNLLIQKIPPEPIRIKNVYYDLDKAILTEKSKNSIDSLVYKVLVENPDIIIELSSHTDHLGTDEYNMKLSQKRAESVVNYLISKGIAKERLIAKGYGETMPLAPNTKPDGSDNPEGREKNRRTEFKIIGLIDREVIQEE